MVHLQESLHQRVLHFLFGANRKKVFCDSFAWTQALYSVMRQRLAVRRLGGRENAHAASTKGVEQCAVLKLADDARPDGTLLKPPVKAATYSRVRSGQQHGNIAQALWKVLTSSLHQGC